MKIYSEQELEKLLQVAAAEPDATLRETKTRRVHLLKIDNQTALSQKRAAAASFVAAHPEFYACAANEKIIADWLGEDDWTRENLEKAYEKVKGRLFVMTTKADIAAQAAGRK